MGGRRQQQQRQHYRRYYPRLVIGLCIFVIISFMINLNILSLSLFAVVNGITEEEHQQHHQTQTQEQENLQQTQNENVDNNNNVCVWFDEKGKEICGNSGDNDNYNDNGDAINNLSQYLTMSEATRVHLLDDFEDKAEFEYYYDKDGEDEEEEETDSNNLYDDLYYEFNCNNQDDKDQKNIHKKETWELFNKVYNKILKESNTKQTVSSPIPSTGFITNGYQYDIEIKYNPIFGRGVFALEDISKGSLLYISINTATFLEGQIFRNFLYTIPKQFACDVLIWSYVREIKPTEDVLNDYNDEYYNDPKFMICCDLDEGSFINSAYDENEYNMALGTKDDGTFYEDSTLEQKKNELWYGCKMHFYASTDIKKGDEIRADYSDFVEEDGWKYLGL
jgi:hypothetical protein